MKKSKTKMVKDFLVVNESITALDGLKFGITRLSAIIFNLEKNGWIFKRISVTLTDDFGYTAQYTKYIFVSKPIIK